MTNTTTMTATFLTAKYCDEVDDHDGDNDDGHTCNDDIEGAGQGGGSGFGGGGGNHAGFKTQIEKKEKKKK